MRRREKEFVPDKYEIREANPQQSEEYGERISLKELKRKKPKLINRQSSLRGIIGLLLCGLFIATCVTLLIVAIVSKNFLLMSVVLFASGNRLKTVLEYFYGRKKDNGKIKRRGGISGDS